MIVSHNGLKTKYRPAMLMSTNKAETAVRGCLIPVMIVRMRTVMATPQGWCKCVTPGFVSLSLIMAG